MTVRSMAQVMEACAAEHLATLVPEDVDCIFNLSTVMMPNVCSEGHMHGVRSVYQIGLHLIYPEVEQNLPREISVGSQVDLCMVSDGDTALLESLLDGLWEQVVFLRMMSQMVEDDQFMEGMAELEEIDEYDEYDDEGPGVIATYDEDYDDPDD